MRRIAIAILAVFMLVLTPVAAMAQVAEVEALRAALLELDAAETVEDFAEAAVKVAAAAEVLKEVATEVDFAELDAAIEALDAAITGGDLDEIAAAAAAVAAAGETVAAAAEEGAGDGTEEPTAVDTGSEVATGPNVGLLIVAALTAMLAGAALTVRRGVARR